MALKYDKILGTLREQDGTTTIITSGVAGPLSSINNSLARFYGTNGLMIHDSTATLNDLGNLTLSGNITTTQIYTARSGTPSTILWNDTTGKWTIGLSGSPLSAIATENLLSVLSGSLQSQTTTISSNLITVSGNLNTLSATVLTNISNINTISGNLITVSGNLTTVSGNLNILSGKVLNGISNTQVVFDNNGVLSGVNNVEIVNGVLTTTNLKLTTSAGVNKIPVSDASGNLTLQQPIVAQSNVVLVSSAGSYAVNETNYLYNVYLADTTAGDITFRFMTGIPTYNKVYVFKKIDNSANIAKITSNFSQMFDGSTDYNLTSLNEAITVIPAPAISGFILQ